MYYEVYVDVLLVENLWMNTLLLVLTAWMEQERIRPGRLLASAGFGSVGACFLTAFSAYLSGITYFLGTWLLAAGMIWILFGRKRHFGFRVLVLFLEGFLLNGTLGYLEQFHPLAGVWLGIFGGTSAAALLAAERMQRARREEKARSVPVLLKYGSRELLVEALYDTGNGLYDPASKKAVSILAQELLDELLDQPGLERLPHLIPCRTISGSGLLTGYALDCMVILSPGGEKFLKRPLVAGMPEKSSQYQLILHRDLLSS